MKERKPRICFVALRVYAILANRHDLKFSGGAEIQQSIVSTELARRGYDVSIVSLDYGQGESERINGIRILKTYDEKKHLPVLRFFHPRLTSLWKALQRADADIYYQRGASFLAGIVSFYCRMNGKKFIFAAAHDSDFIPGQFLIRHARDKWLYAHGLHRADAVLAQHERQKESASKLLGLSANIIPNCFQETRGNDNDDAMNECDVLWAATIKKIKRPDIVLRLAELLPEYRFRMIGGAPLAGDKSFYDEIRDRAAGLENLEFLGYVPFIETDGHFRSARVFVNTSEEEGFPNTFLQAWSRGVPTVSFVDVGASFEGKSAGHAVSGVTDMKEALRKLLENEACRRDDGERCRRYFESRHTIENVMPRYENLFRSLSS